MIVLRIASAAMAALFLYSAAVQLDDPDPLRWAAIYLLGAAVSAAAAAGRLPWAAGAGVASIAALWCLVLVFRTLRGSFFDDSGREMLGIVEEGRELMGLGLIAAWCGAMAFAARRRGRPGAPGIAGS